MSGINGRWMLASCDGLMDYMQAIGASAEAQQKAKALEVTGPDGGKEEFNFSGDTLVARLIAKDGSVKTESTLSLGAETPAKSLDGRDIKVTVTRNGDVFTRQETGAGYNATWTRTISGDNMTVVMQCGGATCTRKLTRA